MKNGILNFTNALTEKQRTDLCPSFEDGNIFDPNSEWGKSNERFMNERKGMSGFLLKILLPKSLCTTPPPDRKIYY